MSIIQHSVNLFQFEMIFVQRVSLFNEFWKKYSPTGVEDVSHCHVVSYYFKIIFLQFIYGMVEVFIIVGAIYIWTIHDIIVNCNLVICNYYYYNYNYINDFQCLKKGLSINHCKMACKMASNLPSTWQECISMARICFEKWFNFKVSLQSNLLIIH